jgi:hypothetical protein
VRKILVMKFDTKVRVGKTRGRELLFRGFLSKRENIDLKYAASMKGPKN